MFLAGNLVGVRRRLFSAGVGMHKLFFSNLVPGTLLFNRYELIGCLSANNIGGVYVCRCVPGADKLVALKVLSTAASRDPKLVQDFRREVAFSLRISHPNVVAGVDYHSDAEFTAFAMEFVEGGTLADYLERKQQLSVAEVVDCLTQLAAGLAVIHEAGIIHRDLKPENILVDAEGRLKIADFGIAASEFELCKSNRRDVLRGTVNYLSPEYIQSGKCDQRSDIYAFGVIAYELMSGRLPFWGNSLIDTLTKRVQFDPPAPRVLRPELPRALSDLALRAMKRNPLRRYQSVKEIQEHLEVISRLGAIVSAAENEVEAPSARNETQLLRQAPLAA